MCRLQRRNDSLGLRQQLAGIERFGIRCGNILGALEISKPRMFGTDRWIVESRRDGVRSGDLPSFVLQNVGVGALQNPGETTTKSSRMVAELLAASAGLHADELHLLLSNKLVENPNRIRSAANASDDGRR